MSGLAAAHRLAIVLSHPTQYYSPWFRWLRAHTDLTFRVFYLWEFGVTTGRDRQFEKTFRWDVDLLSGYDQEFIPNVARDPGTHRFGGLRNPALPARLAAWRPTAVLFFGYKWNAHAHGIFWAWRRRLPLLFRGDSHLLGREAPPPTTRLALRIGYARFSAFLTVGAANRDYFTTFGVAANRLFFAPHSVNHEHFDPRRSDHNIASEKLRAELRIAPDTRVVLFAGKFVTDKQPLELLRAFLALKPPQATLLFVGDGPEKAALQELAQSAPTGAVHFLPFANQTEMPPRYLCADVFVLPSRGHYETWGLAVNEAMHMGVPALVSDRVGCQRDLVSEGATGWVFPTAEPSGLRDALARALAGVRAPADREQLRQNVTTRISGYTYAQTSAGLLAALATLPSPRTT